MKLLFTRLLFVSALYLLLGATEALAQFECCCTPPPQCQPPVQICIECDGCGCAIQCKAECYAATWCFSCPEAAASEWALLSTPITLEVENMTLSEALSLLEGRGLFRFVVWDDPHKRVDLKADRSFMAALLSELENSAEISFPGEFQRGVDQSSCTGRSRASQAARILRQGGLT